MILFTALLFCASGLWFAVTGENYTGVFLIVFLVVLIKQFLEDKIK